MSCLCIFVFCVVKNRLLKLIEANKWFLNKWSKLLFT